MKLTSEALGMSLTPTFLSNILFSSCWKYVNATSMNMDVILDDLMPGFAQAGYLKVIHKKSNLDADNKINFEKAFASVADPQALLKEGFVGFPVIYSQYSLSFNEKVNALSAFNEVEYLVATGSNPKQASLAGYILPNNVILNQLNPTDTIIDVVKSTGNETSAKYAHAIGSTVNDLMNAPPPDPYPLIQLYNDRMRVYNSIKNESRLYVYGPGGLLVEGQAVSLEIRASAELASVLQFTMGLIVTKVAAKKTAFSMFRK